MHQTQEDLKPFSSKFVVVSHARMTDGSRWEDR